MEMELELYQVNDKSNGGKKIQGFSTKASAKAMRNGLQMRAKGSLPEIREKQGEWLFDISLGKDHYQVK